jgi:hypothetical protein
MYLEYEGNRTHQYYEHPDSRYLLNSKGKLFWEGVGGFEKQDQNRRLELKEISARNQRMEKNEVNLVEWTRILAVRTHSLRNWTRIVGIGAVALVVWEIMAYILEHCF